MNTIAATTTRTGLTVSAELDTGDYLKGIKISDREIQNLEKQNVLRVMTSMASGTTASTAPAHEKVN